MSGGHEPPQMVPHIRDTSTAPQSEPEHCVLAIPGPQPEHRASIDGVRVRLEPGWWILKQDQENESIRNESDEDRFEFMILLQRVNLSAIAPEDFLRLDILLNEHPPGWESPATCESASQGSLRRWNAKCHGYIRRGRIYLASSPARTWMHTREIDSRYTKYRTLVTAHDGLRGLLIRYTDIDQLTAGRDEARRIFESIDFDEPDDALVADPAAPAENYRQWEEAVMKLPARDRALWCAENGDKWYAEDKTADAIATFMTLIETERKAGEPPAGLGNSYARLARALVAGGLLDHATTAFDTALSLMKTGATPQEIVGDAKLQYGIALYQRSTHLVDAISALGEARELLEGRESDTLAGADYHLGLALKRQYEEMIQFDAEVRAVRKPKAWAELPADEREAVQSYLDAKGWRRFPATKKDSMAALRSAITRMERESPPSQRLEIARAALSELGRERGGLWTAIRRLLS